MSHRKAGAGNVGLVTYDKFPDLTDDDRPLIDEFKRVGFQAQPVRWDDMRIRWTDYDALVLRSCWDYHLRSAEFTKWLQHIEHAGVRLWNPYVVVRWNLHKRYLRQLASRGILIPHTVWINRGGHEPLSQIMQKAGWREAMVKPAISASATETWRTTVDGAADGARFAELALGNDLLVQEIVPEIAAVGEWSLVFIDGKFSHAAMKRPASGDFRVQSEHGGSAEPARAPKDLVSRGITITDEIPAGWLYARIDGVVTSRGFMLMEVECIEPHLFFSFEPDSRRRLATALARLIGQAGAR